MDADKILARFCKRLVALDMDIFGLRKQAQDVDIPESEIKGWRSTETGAHFPVKNGQTVAEAAKEFVAEKKEQPKERSVKEYEEKFLSIAKNNSEALRKYNKKKEYIEQLKKDYESATSPFHKSLYKGYIDEEEKIQQKEIKRIVDESEGNYHIAPDLMEGHGWEGNNEVYRWAPNGREALSNEELKKYGSNITSPEKEEEFNSAQKKLAEKLSPKEREAIEAYTGQFGDGSYQSLNEYLRNGGQGNPKMDARVETLSSALKQPIGKGITVMRGQSAEELPIDKKTLAAIKRIAKANFDNPEDREKIKVALKGKEITNKGFTSTGHTVPEGFNERPVQIIFKTPPQARALDISALSKYGSESKFDAVFGALMGKSKMLESEVLFDKGMRYKIDDVKFAYRPGYGKGKTAKPKGQVVLVATVLTDEK